MEIEIKSAPQIIRMILSIDFCDSALNNRYTNDCVTKSNTIHVQTNMIRLVLISVWTLINYGKNDEKKIMSLGGEIPIKNPLLKPPLNCILFK